MYICFEDTLTADDVKRHIAHSLKVPPGSSQLDVRLHFSPSRVGRAENMLCLTLFDPGGFRGAGHRGGDTHEVHVSAARATPGYRPGPLPPGLWTVEIDTHMIGPGAPCRYQLDVAIADGADGSTESTHSESAPSTVSPIANVARPGAGWYRGDLHTHTVHSDGDWDVAGLVEAARAHGLDFVALTDHNTVTGLPEMDRASSADLLTIAGVELTTFWGHALCLGTRRWVDWRTRKDGRTMPDVVREASKNGHLFVISHPCSIGDPICTGCDWRYPDVMPGPARIVEVWNGPWGGENNHERALVLWYEWLNQGYRMVATGGSDAHAAAHYPGWLVNNVVRADALSEEEILGAIESGHLYLSVGPHLTLTAHDGQDHQAMMGDALPAGKVTMTVEWDGCPAGALMRIVADGEPLREWRAGSRGERIWSLAAGQARWYVAEMRDGDGQMLALTNPIFFSREMAEFGSTGAEAAAGRR
jgi:hypothetical protein